MQDPKLNHVVVFTGLPGTGKSALAEHVARQLMLGQSVVVDCLINDDVAARWHDNVCWSPP